MEPIGPLMWEHRTIEQALRLMERELAAIREKSDLHPEFLKNLADFFRTYADRTHHGKEEDILFKELEKKPLSGDDAAIIRELKSEHVRGRELVKQLCDGAEAYSVEKAKGKEMVAGALEELLKLYPRHIEKEDRHFFYPALEYFTREERDEMLKKFSDFDKELIHEKYKAVIEDMGKMLGPSRLSVPRRIE